MDIRQLKYFVAVAEKLNFTEAAKSLFVAQSAVSQQIAELEKKLNVTLFERNRRSVKLTQAGNVLYHEAVDLLKRFDEVQEITMNAHLGLKGHLRIGYIGYGDRMWIPKIIRAFKKEYPEVTLDVNRYNQGELTKALNEDMLDVVVTFSFGIENKNKQGRVESYHIYTESLCAVVASDNMISQTYEGKSIPLEVLSEESFIIQNRHESPQGFDKTLQICNAYGFSPNIVNTPKLVQTVLLLVEANMGVALLPSSIKAYAGPNLTFLPLDINSEARDYEIVAAWKANNTNPSLDYLIKTIKDLVQKDHHCI